MVKYSEIDIEIRKIVSLIIDYKGITTTFSCAGHKEGDCSN